MKLQHSPQRSQWVTGHVARSHSDVGRAKLEQIVADALEGALFYDHDQISNHRTLGRSDSVRTDGGKQPMMTPKRDAAERLRTRKDEALASVRSAHKYSRGMTKQDAQTRAPEPKASADSMADSIRNAWRK